MKKSNVLAWVGIGIFLVPIFFAVLPFSMQGWAGFIGILYVGAYILPIAALLSIAFLVAAIFVKRRECY
jgi:hypothetical protein